MVEAQARTGIESLNIRETSLYHLLLVCLGGGIGAGLRHMVNLGAARLLGLSFPWGTFSVNIIGSLLMGLVAGWFAHRAGASQDLRLFLATGILGGFTTFSAFSLDTMLLWQRGDVGLAALYVLGSVAGAILFLFAGLWLARTLL